MVYDDDDARPEPSDRISVLKVTVIGLTLK